MVAIGEVHPARIVTNAGARPGDALVLTKPIGTGILTTALKRDLLTAADLAPAVAVMTTLNAGAARALRAVDVHAATDVTGFGLPRPRRSGAWSPGRRGASQSRDADPRHPRVPRAHPGGDGRAGAGRPGAPPGGADAPRDRICGRGRATRSARRGGQRRGPAWASADDGGGARVRVGRPGVVRGAPMRTA